MIFLDQSPILLLYIVASHSCTGFHYAAMQVHAELIFAVQVCDARVYNKEYKDDNKRIIHNKKPEARWITMKMMFHYLTRGEAL